MNRFLILLMICVSCVMLSSCNYFSQYDNVENSRALRVGMTKHQVLKIMGEPLRDERFNRPNVWYYYVNTEWHDFISTEDECMPIVFAKGKVVGWGNRYFNEQGLKHKYAD